MSRRAGQRNPLLVRVRGRAEWVAVDAVVLDAVVLDAVVPDAVVLDAVVLDAVVPDAVVPDAVETAVGDATRTLTVSKKSSGL